MKIFNILVAVGTRMMKVIYHLLTKLWRKVGSIPFIPISTPQFRLWCTLGIQRQQWVEERPWANWLVGCKHVVGDFHTIVTHLRLGVVDRGIAPEIILKWNDGYSIWAPPCPTGQWLKSLPGSLKEQINTELLYLPLNSELKLLWTVITWRIWK